MAALAEWRDQIGIGQGYVSGDPAAAGDDDGAAGDRGSCPRLVRPGGLIADGSPGAGRIPLARLHPQPGPGAGRHGCRDQRTGRHRLWRAHPRARFAMGGKSGSAQVRHLSGRARRGLRKRKIPGRTATTPSSSPSRRSVPRAMFATVVEHGKRWRRLGAAPICATCCANARSATRPGSFPAGGGGPGRSRPGGRAE